MMIVCLTQCILWSVALDREPRFERSIFDAQTGFEVQLWSHWAGTEVEEEGCREHRIVISGKDFHCEVKNMGSMRRQSSPLDEAPIVVEGDRMFWPKSLQLGGLYLDPFEPGKLDLLVGGFAGSLTYGHVQHYSETESGGIAIWQFGGTSTTRWHEKKHWCSFSPREFSIVQDYRSALGQGCRGGNSIVVEFVHDGTRSATTSPWRPIVPSVPDRSYFEQKLNQAEYVHTSGFPGAGTGFSVRYFGNIVLPAFVGGDFELLKDLVESCSPPQGVLKEKVIRRTLLELRDSCVVIHGGRAWPPGGQQFIQEWWSDRYPNELMPDEPVPTNPESMSRSRTKKRSKKNPAGKPTRKKSQNHGCKILLCLTAQEKHRQALWRMS